MKNYIENIDYIISKIGICLSIFVLFYFQGIVAGRTKYFSITFLSGVILTLLIYILIRNKISPTVPHINYFQSKYINLKSILTLYLLLYSISIYILFVNTYHRPVIYFIIIAFLCSLILIQIYTNPGKKISTSIILFEILLLSVNIRWGIIYEYSGMIGSDPIYHLNLAKEIVISSSIPSDFQYSPHPILHLLISVTKVLTTLTYKNAFVFSVGFLVATLLPFFVYVSCKNIFTEQIALISALFVAICNYLIWYAYMLFTTSMGLVYFIILLYFMTSSKIFESKAGKTLFIAIYAMIVLVHPLTNVVALYTMIIIYSIFLIYRVFEHGKNTKIFLSNNILLMFISFTLAYWMYYSIVSETSFFDFVIQTIYNKLTFVEIPDTVMSYPLNNVKIIDEIINMIGSISLFCFAIIGFFHTIRIKMNNSLMMAYVIIGFIIFFSAAACQVGGFENILPQRWFAFSYLLLAIPAALGFQVLNNLNIRQNLVMLIQFIIIFVISFLLITSSIANMDSPLYSKDISIRIGATNSEIAAMNNIVKHSNINIVTDFRYMASQAYNSDSKIEYFTDNMDINMLSPYDLVLLRDYVRNNRIDVPYASANGGAPSHISKEFLDDLDSIYANKIYDNRNVTGYLVIY